MRLPVNFNKFFLFVCICLKSSPIFANNTNDTSKISILNSHLFNGSIYTRYAANATGYPYFDTNKPLIGSVFYDGHLYTNLQLQLDIYTQELVLISPYLQQPIVLVMSKIDSFKIGGHRFINIKQNTLNYPLKGFVELVYKNPFTTIWAKHEKKIEQSIRSDDPNQYLNEYSTFFIQYENNIKVISNESDLLDVFKENRVVIKKLLRNKKLSFKKNPRFVLQEIVYFLEGQ